MQKIFLTGANGHIGANITRELLARGYEVVGYVRETSDLRSLEGLDIELRVGDIQDQVRVSAAAAGCDAIIHTAAVYSMWAPDDEEIISPSIVGTDNILLAAADHGIKRLAYTSSSAAIGGAEDPDTVRDETDWPANTRSPYYAAKTDSEKLAHALADQMDIELIIFNPTIVIGPYDYRITPSMSMIHSALNNRGTYWNGMVGYVHVGDVARLHVDGLEKGTPGERYIANAVSLPNPEVAKIWREMFGVRMINTDMPEPIFRAAGYLLGLVSKLTGAPPLFDDRTYDDFLKTHGNYANDKSVDAFGIEYTDLETAFADTAAWLIHAGFVKGRIADRLRERYPPRQEWVD